MRRGSPPLDRTRRAARLRQRVVFSLLAALSFLLGFSLGEGKAPGLRPVDREGRGRVAEALSSHSSEGPLELTAFVDYSSPLTLRTHRVLERVRRAYGARVITRIRLLPERASASSWLAHSALAAAEVEQVAEVERDRIATSALEHSRAHLWSEEWVTGWANELEIGPDALRSSLSSPATARILARDRALARSFGIQRAPAMILEGRRLDGPVPYEVLREEIDDHLVERASLSL